MRQRLREKKSVSQQNLGTFRVNREQPSFPRHLATNGRLPGGTRIVGDASGKPFAARSLQLLGGRMGLMGFHPPGIQSTTTGRFASKDDDTIQWIHHSFQYFRCLVAKVEIRRHRNFGVFL